MAEFQNILALDTALGGCTASVVTAEKSFSRSEQMPRGQAEHLVPFAQAAMHACDLAFAELDAVLCTIGPGAFTGVRIGMSAARAFGFAHDVPVYGITTLDALALNYKGVEAFAVILETKRSDYYVQAFDGNKVAVTEPKALEYDEVLGVLEEGQVLIGDAVNRFVSEGADGFTPVKGYEMVDMENVGQKFVQNPQSVFVLDPDPVYLRGADVSQPKNKPRVLAS